MRLNKVIGWFGHHREREREGTFDAYLELIPSWVPPKTSLQVISNGLVRKMVTWKLEGRGRFTYKEWERWVFELWFLLFTLLGAYLLLKFGDSLKKWKFVMERVWRRWRPMVFGEGREKCFEKIVNGSVWKILEFSSLKISWLANTYFALGSIKSHR